MTDIDITRHVDVFSPNAWPNLRVDVIGAGAIGTHAAVSLAKLGLTEIHLWDTGVVSPQDVASHAFAAADVGKPKVEALATTVARTTGLEVTAHNEGVQSQRLGDIVFLLTDDAEARQRIWQRALRNKIRIKLVIEARLTENGGLIYTTVPSDRAQVAFYDNALRNGAAPDATNVTASAAEIAAGHAVWQFIRWAAIQKDKPDALEPLIELPENPSGSATQALAGCRVDVIGAGATGSRIVLSLARLGLNVHVWDFDEVEAHNIANQAYRTSDIGRLKIEALREVVVEATGKQITIHNERVDGSQQLGDVVFILTDTMASRKEIWQALRNKPNTRLVLETRMGTDSGRIYTVAPGDEKVEAAYEGTLYDDVEAEVSACGTSITVGSTAETVSGLAVRQLLTWASNPDQVDNEVLLNLRPSFILNSSFAN